MSKGSKIVPIRFEAELLAEIMAALKRRNATTRDEEITLSEWVRRTCKDKLKHLKR